MTINTANRECSLGGITNSELVLTDFGKIAAEWFGLTQKHIREVEIPGWVVIPNHIHMVVEIFDPCTGGVSPPVQGEETSPVPPQIDIDSETPNNGKFPFIRRQAISPLQAQKSLLAKVIAYYKYQTTKQINLVRKSAGIRFWHRNYYEHIIRNEAEYDRILLYIEGNPQKWIEDQLHPDSLPNRFNRGH